MSCNRCKKDDCEGQCEMDSYFKDYLTNDSLIYGMSGFRGSHVVANMETIEKLALNLPDVDYILDSIVNYMFTNHLTVKDGEKDKKLYEFLWSLNFNGQTNLDVIKTVAKGYRKYGYYGLLNMGKGQGLVAIHPVDIVACVIDNPDKPVIRQTYFYLIKRSALSISPFDRVEGNYNNTFSYSEEEVKKILADPKKYEKDVIVVTDKEFACVRLDPSQVYGISPLLKDRKRVELILNILDRMNYDIVRNGIGTIALQAKDTLEEQISESVEQGSSFGSGELMDLSRTAKEDRTKAIAEDMEHFAKKLEETEYNDAIVYSGKFQNLEQLKRDTRAVDFLDYLSLYSSSVISQIFGVPARLFDLGKTVSNIGTHSIIDNSMKNIIIPMRDSFLAQCMQVLEDATGLKHIQFASYEFTNNYNYNNDLTILEVYEKLLTIDADKAEAYLAKNLIV